MGHLQILVVLPVQEVHKQLLEQSAPEARFIYASEQNLSEELLKTIDIVIGNIPIPYLQQAKQLKWIQLSSAGANQYTQKGVLSDKVLLTNATGAYGLAISEYMLSAVLTIFKNFHQYRDQQKQHGWHYAGQVKSIYGCTALILGLGDIGGAFAKRMKALGASTIGIKRRPKEKPDYLDELHTMEYLQQLLPRADVVAISLPETPQTYHLINAERLALMKEDAVLINIGRGSIVDTDALYTALIQHRLRGAVLDVTDPEPLPQQHPLWDCSNVLITPHISGGYSLPETFEKIIKISADNLKRYISGQILHNLVDFETGYCK